MPNGDHGPPYHSEQPLFSERLYADAKERIRLLELEVAEARRCPGCGAEAGTVHMGCVVCDQRSRAEKAEAERDEALRTVDGARVAGWILERKQLEAEVARLTQGIGMLDDEAESLGREADRLREALKEIVREHTPASDAHSVARAALAKEDTP